MAREIHLVKGDIQKVSYLGFSWTTFFFNYWVPLFRRDWKSFFIIFIISFLFEFLIPYRGVGTLIVSIAAAYYYNKYYTEQLIAGGFRPLDERTEIELKKEGIFYN